MFRDLIPLLSDRFHVVAPDLPGFGRTALPSRDKFTYTFENLAKVIGRFTEVIGLDRFALYIFDYGAPTGLRIALANPDRITGIISQNGNAYVEGLSDGWNPDPALLARPDRCESTGAPRAADASVDTLAIHARRTRHIARGVRRQRPRFILYDPAGSR